MIQVNVKDVSVAITNREKLTRGMVGKQVRISYTNGWLDKNIVACFSDGEEKQYDIIDPGVSCVIPHELLTEAGKHCYLGFYGYVGSRDEIRVATPTVWCDLGEVLQSPDPEGDESTTVESPVWAQLESQKQDKLTAGENITIENNVINAIQPVYVAGDNIEINDFEISANVPQALSDLNNDTNFISESVIDEKITTVASAKMDKFYGVEEAGRFLVVDENGYVSTKEIALWSGGSY